MAIASSTLDQGASSPGTTSFSTGTITPTANACVILNVVTGNPTTTPSFNSISASGCGLTWTLVAEQRSTSGVFLQSFFVGQGASPSSGAVTVSGISSSDNVLWQVVEFTGVKTTGAYGGNGVASLHNGSGTQPTVTLPNSLTTGSAIYASFMHANFGSITWSGGLTAQSTPQVSGINGTIYDGKDLTATSTTVAATVTGTPQSWTMLAVEILPYVAGGFMRPPLLNGISTGGPFFANPLG